MALNAGQRDAITVLLIAADSSSIGVGVEDAAPETGPNAEALPRTFALHQNYPNPFNPTTMILYDVPVASRVRLAVYNVLGQRVARLLDRSQTPGRHRVVWDAAGFPSGLYFVRFQTEALAGSHRFEAVKKMILLR